MVNQGCVISEDISASCDVRTSKYPPSCPCEDSKMAAEYHKL